MCGLYQQELEWSNSLGNLGGQAADAEHQLVRVGLVGLQPIGAVLGRGGPLTAETAVGQRTHQSRLAAERLVDAGLGHPGLVGDGGDGGRGETVGEKPPLGGVEDVGARSLRRLAAACDVVGAAALDRSAHRIGSIVHSS